MCNKHFKDEQISYNDLFFVCSMIERVARHLKVHNREVVNAIGADGLYTELSNAPVNHCENPAQVVDDWIKYYHLQPGNFDITQVDPRLVLNIPSPFDMGAVYARLIKGTAAAGETEVDGILRVYNSDFCNRIDNYNGSTYYEPSQYLASEYFKDAA